MELGTVMSVAQTLFAALQCSDLRHLFSRFGYESELDDLRRTVSIVRAVLKDAEDKQNGLVTLSNQDQHYINELKDAVYDADDLLDEFITIAEVKGQHFTHNGAVLGEVRLFFSRFNRLSFARKMKKSVGKITKKLDGIAADYKKFGSKVCNEPIKAEKVETGSYVHEEEMIGRVVDVEILVGMLMRNDVGCNFVTVVGIGGLGKTALAELVYNDPRVESEFPLRMWACVSDQESEDLRVKDILIKILKSVTRDSRGDYTMDQAQVELQEELGEKKFLLVLDDVWTEDREQWLKLERLLKCGNKGSWVMVTTRSKETARIVGDGVMYELEGLSLEHSWQLFKRAAFGQSKPSADFVEIGYQIIDMCANVPLALRVVGSLLYGKTMNRWKSFQEKGLACLSDGENKIKSILKLSYHRLESHLKSCFTYCAIYPKDFIIEKETLLSLWMAQGYIPFGDGQSMYDAAEECLSILLRRCFFQDVERDMYGEITSFKVHDLMHDIAQDVAGKEICEGSSNSMGLAGRVCHVSSVDESFMKRFPDTRRIRTCLLAEGKDEKLLVGYILANCVRLRSLTLIGLQVPVLPESIGSLVHLRLLDLSSNLMLERLPNSTTKLHNLLTLNLSWCRKLKELPKDLRKLHKLHCLNISECSNLKHLPTGVAKLVSLHTLGKYMVGGKHSTVLEYFDHLENLKLLNKLKGSIEIDIEVPKNAKYVEEENRGGAYMKGKEHLNCIVLRFKHVDKHHIVEHEEALLEEMQPHSNLKGLVVVGYKGTRLPSWANCLPNLINLELSDCDELEYLPDLRRLSHLKVLKLVCLPKLEYVENVIPTIDEYSKLVLLTYPRLNYVVLNSLPKLKAWFRGSKVPDYLADCLPRLTDMRISDCPGFFSYYVSNTFSSMRSFRKTVAVNHYNFLARKSCLGK